MTNSFSEEHSQDFRFPKITLSVACLANITGIYGDGEDEVNGSENEEDIDNDPEVVVDSSDESDANDNTKPFLVDEKYLGCHISWK